MLSTTNPSTLPSREHRLSDWAIAAPVADRRLRVVGDAMVRACDYLLSLQRSDGHWVGELQGDTILETEYLLLLAFLGRESDPCISKLANYILAQQNADGGWSNYPGGPADISCTVKAYFALKIAGYHPDDDRLRRAREVILSLGGAARCNSFTRFYLALLGQIPYDDVPAVPPEMIFFPNWAYFNIYAMSSWTRTIVIPLSIFYAYKPVRKLPDRLGIKELFVSDEANGKKARRWLTWHNFFTLTDKAIKYLEPPQQNVAGNRWQRWFWHARRQLREKAVRHAAAWLLEHFEDSDGVGAIFPPMIYTVIVLRCLGYSDDSPEMRYAMKQLDDLKIEEGDTLRLQPCLSPVWDTTLTMNALADAILDEGSAVEDHATILHALERATRWLLEKEVRRRGDWSVMNPRLEPGGWFFEYRNGFYPDTDDTAMALMALAKTERARYRSYALEPSAFRQQPVAAAAERALRWLLAMQNDDGGWAAFDRNINREVLTKIPFADHNAMLDPSCPDITARVLEALGHYGFDARHPQVQNAIRFLERTQDRDGCWTGRWGVNYIYGAWQVLQGFKQIGYDMHSPVVRRAVRWLKSVQQPNGGWGESCRSYDDPEWKGRGETTASQTAWALLGLVAAGEANSPEVQAGIDYLLRTQEPDGRWREEPFTGTGFPKVFYLKYHMYPLYFPLMALARYERAVRGTVLPKTLAKVG